MTHTPVRVPKTAELVAARLRRMIVRGELAEGESLPSETALMEQFAVSRPTLREAFRVLESESLINVRRGARGGARVQIPEGTVAARYAGVVLEYRGTTLKDVYDARTVIEAPCAGLLAERRTDEDL
ncbi:GntR family transcriptional regulator, partial [Streptomyces sp. NPDC004237]|uniref:FadR/GntR family transcriptional regulator n=1 Tax=Streptomyces sp. NPDC004237 TaxID=3154455 RepID=UPI0033AB1690